MKKRAAAAAVLALALVAGLSAGCAKKNTYPSKDIQFYVNADAGGGTDSICRKITQIVEKDGKVKFYLVNKPGVADSVGPSLCMDAQPDGYTMCNVNYGSVISAVYNKVVDNYSMDRLTPIGMISQESDSIVVDKDAPYKTFQEFIDYAKAHPGEIRVGDQGIGSRVYLILTMLEQDYGIKFNKISYSSSAPQREALLSGEVDVILSSLGDFNSLLESGEGIGIVEFSSVQNAAYPDVPTAKDLGLDDKYQSSSFIYLAVPAKTPDEIVTYLKDTFKKAAESEEYISWITSIGVTPRWVPGEEVVDFVKNLQEKDFKALDELKAQGLL